MPEHAGGRGNRAGSQAVLGLHEAAYPGEP